METLSLVVGIISIVLAIVSMLSAKHSEQQSLHNFEKTQDLLQKNYEDTQRILQDNYDKTKDVLSEIDKKATVIDNVVQLNQEKMMSTLTNIVTETVIPQKRDMGEELGVKFFENLINNPENAANSINSLNELVKLTDQLPNKKNGPRKSHK